MIELKKVSKSFGSYQALSQLDLHIATETTTVLIGASGCGKSTIMRLITALIEPDEGSIEFDGEVIDQKNKISFRQQIGYVIQGGGLFPHLTASDNITLVAKELKHSKSEIAEKLIQLCALTHFDSEKLLSFPSELSGGQIQRVALMRALMLDPKVLLLDEPLGSLDPIIRASLQSDLKEIFQQLKKTVLLVTHDMGEASYFGDTLVLLRQGQILQQGKLSEFVDAPANRYVTDFITSQRSLTW